MFSSAKYGPHMIQEYQQLAQSASYKFTRAGGVAIYINGMKIKQLPKGMFSFGFFLL